MKEEQTIDFFQPPEPSLKFIAQTGEVEVSFNMDMKVVPLIDMIEQGTVELNGVDVPVVDIKVIPGDYSEP